MLENFPNFTPLKLSTQTAVRDLTDQFEPYSDYNFLSLWAWNLSDEASLCILNSNLVAKFADYGSGEPFFSFIGETDVNQTVEILLDYSKTQLGESRLKLIPEISTREIDGTRFNISADRDNFDYLFSTDEIRQFSGKKFAKRRNTVSSLRRTHDSITHRLLDLHEPKDESSLVELFTRIKEVRDTKGLEDDHNLPVFLRLLACANQNNLIITGVYIDEVLVATLVNELLDKTYAVAHLMTADIGLHAGLYAYLMKQNAEYLHQAGVALLNFEQDLGVQNLRKAKTLYRPVSFLRKYQISHLHTN